MLHINCDEAWEWMGALADREVRGLQARRVRSHVEECSPCNRRYQAILEWKRHALRVAVLRVPTSLRARLLESVAGGRVLPQTTRNQSQTRLFGRLPFRRR